MDVRGAVVVSNCSNHVVGYRSPRGEVCADGVVGWGCSIAVSRSGSIHRSWCWPEGECFGRMDARTVESNYVRLRTWTTRSGGQRRGSPSRAVVHWPLVGDRIIFVTVLRIARDWSVPQIDCRPTADQMSAMRGIVGETNSFTERDGLGQEQKYICLRLVHEDSGWWKNDYDRASAVILEVPTRRGRERFAS